VKWHGHMSSFGDSQRRTQISSNPPSPASIFSNNKKVANQSQKKKKKKIKPKIQRKSKSKTKRETQISLSDQIGHPPRNAIHRTQFRFLCSSQTFFSQIFKLFSHFYEFLSLHRYCSSVPRSGKFLLMLGFGAA